jgi:hypothetical protein
MTRYSSTAAATAPLWRPTSASRTAWHSSSIRWLDMSHTTVVYLAITGNIKQQEFFFYTNGFVNFLKPLRLIMADRENVFCSWRILKKRDMNVEIILKDEGKEPLPFPNNMENWTCRENVRVDWDCTCRCRMDVNRKGWKQGSRCRKVMDCIMFIGLIVKWTHQYK